MSIKEFSNIFCYSAEGFPTTDSGTLRIAPAGLGWKASSIITIATNEIIKAQWLRSFRGYQLRVYCKSDPFKSKSPFVKFDGFDRNDFDELGVAIKQHFKMVIELKEWNVKGQNWGKAELTGSHLNFTWGKPIFEIPYGCITNANLANKNEVSLDIEPYDQGDQLVDIRMYVPGLAADGEELTAAEFFHNNVKLKADLQAVSGKTVISFQELPFLTPRGRYEMDIYEDFIRLRGKTYDFKIEFKSIMKIFSLQKPDDSNHLVVIALDPPVSQGQTRYPFLVLNFASEDEEEIKVNADDEFRKEFNLPESYENPLYFTITDAISKLCNREIIFSGTFQSHYRKGGVKCSLKATEGFVYLLEKAFLFIPKNSMYIPFRDVSHISFSRVSAGGSNASRTFDMSIHLKSSIVILFSSIGREEHANINKFLQTKDLQTVEEEEVVQQYTIEEDATPMDLDDSDDESEEDEDFNPNKVAELSEDDMTMAAKEEED